MTRNLTSSSVAGKSNFVEFCTHCACTTRYSPMSFMNLHEFQRDGITVCTTFTPFKPENTRLHAKKIDIIIIDVRVVYDHSKGKTLILPKNITLSVTIKRV